MLHKKPVRWHVLLSAGLLVMSSSMLLMRKLPPSLHHSDFITGLSMGVGIGLMLVALIAAKKQQRLPN